MGSSFPIERFRGEIEPWLERERFAWAEAGEILEGAGCWSPLFPARLDDLWMAAVSVVKVTEARWQNRTVDARLDVFEGQCDECGLSGFVRLEGVGVER